MSTLNLSQNILNADANFQAGDWADAGGGVLLDFRGSAQLKRGLDLELGVGVLGRLDASFHKFLAANATAQAQASARLKGQIQAPIDLFGEAGVAVRLQAVAEAAAMIQLGIGLSIGDFIALAEQDPRIHDVAARLFRVFLEELDIGAGVLGKIAFSAMAYVNLAITGRLVEDGFSQPGFTIAGEYGYGLEGGMGYRMYANLGFKDTRRLIRRSVDVIVDAAVEEINSRIAGATHRAIVSSLRAPAKMALRTGFELGLALAESSPSFANTSQDLAQRCVQVLLEEAQRFLLEQLTLLGIELFKRALAEMGVGEEIWASSEPQREAFADKLRALPAEPFEPTSDNALFWLDLTDAAINVALALGGEAVIGDGWVEPVAVVWSAAQLMLVTVERVTKAEVRASFLGGLASANAQVQAFSGALINSAEPPPIIRQFINHALGQRADQTVRQDELVEFLVSAALLGKLVEMYPQVDPVLQIVAGPTNDSLVAAAQTILKNANAFVKENNEFDAVATLRVFTQGLTAYIDVRLENELKPLMYEAVSNNEDLKLYIDEALLATLSFSVKVALNKVIDWGFGGLGYQDALREACSSIVMKLFGRSLVVTTDVLMAHAMQHVSQQLNLAAEHINDRNGIAHYLAGKVDLPSLTEAEEREFLGEVLGDTLRIGAQIFGPLPPATRSRIRQTLYDLLDTVPEPFDDHWLEQLKHDSGIPSQKTVDNLYALGDELGNVLLGYLAEFFSQVMLKLGEKALDFVEENYLAPIQQQLELWVKGMIGLLNQIAARLLALPGELLELGQAILAAATDALAHVQNLLSIASTEAAGSVLTTEIRATVVDAAKASPFWPPVAWMYGAEAGLAQAVSALLPGTLISPIVTALQPTAQNADDFLEEVQGLLLDLSEVDLEENVTQQIVDVFAQRLTARVEAAFGQQDPKITVSFSHFPDPVTGTMRPIVNPLSGQTVTITLVDVEIPLDDVVAGVLGALTGLSLFEDTVRDLIKALNALIAAEDEKALAAAEQAALQEQEPVVEANLAETYITDFDIAILEPTQASAHANDLDLEIFLAGVPLSYLGLGEAVQQRVFCWLNLAPLAMGEFTVEEHRPSGSRPGAADRFDSVHGISILELEHEIDAINSRFPLGEYPAVESLLDEVTSVTSATEPTRTVVYMPGDAVELWGTAYAAEVQAETQRMQRRVFAGHQPYSHAAASRAARLLRHGGVARRTVNGRQPAIAVAGRASLAIGDIGARLTIGEKNSLLARYGPGLLLRLRIPIEQLAEGVNTLAVAILTGHKVKAQPVMLNKAVAFLVHPPEQPVAISTDEIPHTFEHLPAPLARYFGRIQPDFAYRPQRDRTADRVPPSRPYHYTLPPRKERERIKSQALAKVAEEMEKATAAISVLSTVVRTGDLRPYGSAVRPAKRRPWRFVRTRRIIPR